MVKTYTPADQERLLRPALRQGSLRAYALLGRKQFEIEQLALSRVMSLGHDEYGDASWHKSLDQLDGESMEEAADLVFYESVYSLKEAGVIP